MPPLPLLLSSAVAMVLMVLGLHRYRLRRSLPPGPAQLPILGSILHLPRTSVGRAFSDLAKRHGDVLYFNLLGQPMIVLGSFKAASDLLDKRSSNFSGRPMSTVMNLAGLDALFMFMQHDGLWRRHRRAFHMSFGIDRVSHHQSIQLQSAHRLLYRLLTSQHSINDNVAMLVTDTSIPAVYGIDSSTDARSNELSSMIETVRQFLDPLLLPGAYVLEMIPFLRYLPSWVPGMQIMKTVEDGRYAVSSWLEKLDVMSIEGNRDDNARDSMMARLLENTSGARSKVADTKELSRYCAAATILAGTETTQAVVEAFFLAMAMHPDSQKAAQAELDAVVGPDRLPEFSDYDCLPYMRAFVKELTRWHIVTPMGLPHATVHDDEYNGYFIPAGTIVNTNVWAISRDPEEYLDPSVFNPARFLVENPPRDPDDYVFGFGRRLCPGRNFAAASLFIYCASVLHVFNIMPPKDEHGNPVAMEYKPKDDLVSHVEAYDYIVKPRSARAQSLVADLAF